MTKAKYVATRAGIGAGVLLLLGALPIHPAGAAVAPACSEVDVSLFEGVGDDDPVEVSWRVLAGLDYQTGERSERLAEVEGKSVKIPGFTVPLEDFASSATEFLLVPYVGACVHTPPPPPNQLVYVEMDEGKRAKMDGWNPVWLEGTLLVEDVQSVYGSSGFRVVGLSVTPYE